MWLRYDHHTTTRQVRAYRDRPAYVKEDHHATVEVRVDEEAIESAVRRLGSRSTAPINHRKLSLEHAVWAYRSEYLVERSWAASRGARCRHPDVCARDDHATGLIGLLSIALRVLTLVEFGVRRQLAAEEATLAGLYVGNAKRETARPTAEGT